MALNEEQKKLLNEMWKSSYGNALFAFLEDEFAKIGDIATVKSWEDTLARQQAIELLKKLFSFMDAKKKQLEKKFNQYE